MRKFFSILFFLSFFSVNLFSQYNPGISFSTMLNGVKMVMPEKGTIGFGPSPIQATFLEGVNNGTIDIKKTDGTLIKSIRFTPHLIKKPYYYLELNDMDRTELPEGDYTLTFNTEKGPFFIFPFSITKLASDNPFEGTDKYFLEGDWNNWGYFYYSNARPEQMLQWKVWLRYKGVKNEKDVKIHIKVTNDKDGKVICRSRDNVNMTYTLRSDWVRYQFDMIFPENEGIGGAYFKAKNLLEKDGDYTLAMDIDGKEYGKWKFSVKNNKFVYTDRTDRQNADPTSFIEGGLDAFWYGKAD